VNRTDRLYALVEKLRAAAPGGFACSTPLARPPVRRRSFEHAIVQRRVLELDDADKTGTRTERIVEPVALLGVQPNWYLFAWCRLRDAPRAFRLDRTRGAVMSDEIAPDRGLDPSQLEIPELIGRGILGL
jgi:uncharacterized protein (DUF3084 family)